MLRAEPQNRVFTDNRHITGRERRRNPETKLAGLEEHFALSVQHEFARYQVHGWRADELGHEDSLWVVIQVRAGADLLYQSMIQQDDALSQSHGLDLIVRHVDCGCAETLVQLGQLNSHLHPELGVKIGQWLIEEEYVRTANNGASHGDPLALPSTELARAPLQQTFHSEHSDDLVDPRIYLVPRIFQVGQSEAQVLPHRHVRIQGVILEDHCDIAFPWMHGGYITVANVHTAARRHLQSGNEPEESRLSTAGGAEKDHKLAVGKIYVHPVQGNDAPVSFSEYLGQ